MTTPVTRDEFYMRLAIDTGLRRDDPANTPTGSVIVLSGAVIGRGYNEVSSSGDPTAHAEIVAIRKAAAALGTPDLSGAHLYTTAEPCPMCCGAILVAGMSRLILGARTVESDADPWPSRWRWGECRTERLLELAGWRERIELTTGVLVDECQRVRSEWRREHSTQAG